METNKPTECTDCEGRGFALRKDAVTSRPYSELCVPCEGHGTLDDSRKPRNFDVSTVRWAETIHRRVQDSSRMLEVRLLDGQLKLGFYRTMQDRDNRIYWTPIANLNQLESE